MSINGKNYYANLVTEISKVIESAGIFLESGTDFKYFKNALHNVEKSTQLGPKFDPDRKDYDGDSALWIIGRNNGGDIVHTQAFCMVDLKNLSLGNYLEERYVDFIPYILDKNRSEFITGPSSSAVTGKACYHGEFMLKRCYSGLQSGAISTLLFRLATASCMVAWSPDIIFGFMNSRLMLNGLAAKAGFMHSEPDSITWARPDMNRTKKSWIVWLENQDIDHLMKLTAADLDVPFVSLHQNLVEKKVA